MATFSGSLTAKRKGDLVEIAEALGVTDLGSTRDDVLKSVQAFLGANEAELSASPRFKGLFGRRTKPRDSPESEITAAVESKTPEVRKTINKALDRLANDIDPTKIALPDSPLSVAKGKAKDAADAASESLAVALAPAKKIPTDVRLYANKATGAVVKYASDSQKRLDVVQEHLREHFAKPQHLVGTALAVEVYAAFYNIAQFYDHTIFFPPAPGEPGSVASLVHSALSWVPSSSITVPLPELASLGTKSHLWPALTIWFATTVLGPLALSTIFSSQAVTKTHTHNTRSHAHAPAKSTFDPVIFTVLRFATILAFFTDAISYSIRDTVDSTGNLQLRALGSGVLAVLTLLLRP